MRRFHDVVRRVPVAEDLVRYAVRLAAASRPGQPAGPSFINDWVSWGAGLRAAQYLVLGAKARALLEGRVARGGRGYPRSGPRHVSPPDPGRLPGRSRRRHVETVIEPSAGNRPTALTH